jgi:hypothetical protein
MAGELSRRDFLERTAYAAGLALALRTCCLGLSEVRL